MHAFSISGDIRFFEGICRLTWPLFNWFARRCIKKAGRNEDAESVTSSLYGHLCEGLQRPNPDVPFEHPFRWCYCTIENLVKSDIGIVSDKQEEHHESDYERFCPSSSELWTREKGLSEAEQIEEIVTTGSRIKKQDYVSNAPVATVGFEQIELTGTGNTESLLNTLPQTVPGLDRTSDNPGIGTATVNLRGLGTNRTLVLVNGKRVVPTTGGGTVDINNIPNSLIEQIGKDYIRTVLAKGGSFSRAIWGHALRNSLVPIATGFGSILTVMFAGSVIIEQVFEIPGMGRLSLEAIVGRDYPVFMGILSITAILGLVGNILSDFCYVLIDPRINFQEN